MNINILIPQDKMHELYQEWAHLYNITYKTFADYIAACYPQLSKKKVKKCEQ